MDEQETLISKAARLGDSHLEWNEIDFVGWPEFRRMVPTVVGLEIGRLERLISDCDIGSDVYNALVGVRYALRIFVDGIEASEKETVSVRIKYLEQSLLGLSTAVALCSLPDTEILRYIAHRLTYIHNRLELIY